MKRKVLPKKVLPKKKVPKKSSMKIEEAVILFDLFVKLQPIIEKYSVSYDFFCSQHSLEIQIKVSFNKTFIKINDSCVVITCTDPSMKNTQFASIIAGNPPILYNKLLSR